MDEVTEQDINTADGNGLDLTKMTREEALAYMGLSSDADRKAIDDRFWQMSKKYRGKLFYTCDKKGSNPDCDFISWNLPIDGKTCPECGSYMVLKHYGKKAYPKCSNKDCPSNSRKKKSSGSDKDE